MGNTFLLVPAAAFCWSFSVSMANQVFSDSQVLESFLVSMECFLVFEFLDIHVCVCGVHACVCACVC